MVDDDKKAVGGGSRIKEELQNKNYFMRFNVTLYDHFFAKFGDMKTAKYTAGWTDFQKGMMPASLGDGRTTKLVMRVRKMLRQF